MRRTQQLAATATLALSIAVLAACGSDGTSPNNGVGASGGTVSGPNGSQIVIPPGALSSNTQIAVAQSAAGAPALPDGINIIGDMYSFTPHGTTFAVPVTITLPFNPASVPAGEIPAFYKTNAEGKWEIISSAVFGTNTVTAQVSSFSNGGSGNSPRPIVQHLQNLSVFVGQPANFGVITGTGGPFTFRWFRSNDNGATWLPLGVSGDTYVIGQTTISDNNALVYVNVITSTDDTVPSAQARLTVSQPPINNRQLTITIVGSGRVTTNVAGIDCPSITCTAPFELNGSVSLFAQPAVGFQFAGWSGDTDCVDGNLTMTADRACTATFNVAPVTTHALTITIVGNGQVTSNPAGIACPGDCAENFQQGTAVTLTPVGAGGMQLTGWTGDADCTDGNVTMNAARACTATFANPPIGPSTGAVLAAGQDFSFEQVLGNGRISSWGADGAEQLGAGPGNHSRSFAALTPIPATPAFIWVAAGAMHGLAVRNTGLVLGWGYNTFGQLGDGGTQTRADTVIATMTGGPQVTNAVEVCGGTIHSLIRRGSAPYVLAMGSNFDGQIGTGLPMDAITSATRAAVVIDQTPASAISCGDSFSLAVVSGSVRAWGLNTNGQLGNNSTTKSNVPVNVQGLAGVSKVAGGKDHALAIVAGNQLWGWGSNSSGKLGPGATVGGNHLVPIQIAVPAGNITWIAAGDENSAAIIGGVVYVWGTNAQGQLGRGSFAVASDATPQPIVFPAQVTCTPVEVQIGRTSAAGSQLLVRCSDGATYAWGSNVAGKAGLGIVAQTATPTRVLGL